MLNIVICDTDNNFLNKLEQRINYYIDKYQNLHYRVIRFLDVETLLNSDISKFDIVFMGVQFPKMTGIETAAILRKEALHFVLIFISNFVEYAPSGYQVNASRYILKDYLDLFFEEAMEAALNKLGLYKNKINIKFTGHAEKEIYTNDIIYIESKLHKAYFHLIHSQRSLYIYSTLNEIQKELSQENFIRIYQSYLVNLKYLVEAKNYQAKLTQGIELPISKRHFPKVKHQLLLYKE